MLSERTGILGLGSEWLRLGGGLGLGVGEWRIRVREGGYESGLHKSTKMTPLDIFRKRIIGRLVLGPEYADCN